MYYALQKCMGYNTGFVGLKTKVFSNNTEEIWTLEADNSKSTLLFFCLFKEFSQLYIPILTRTCFGK